MVAIDKIDKLFHSNKVKPLGMLLDNKMYGSTVDDLNKDKWYKYDLKLLYREKCAMQDLMKLHNS